MDNLGLYYTFFLTRIPVRVTVIQVRIPDNVFKTIIDRDNRQG